MECWACGTRVPVEARFCPHCGVRLAVPDLPPQASADPWDSPDLPDDWFRPPSDAEDPTLIASPPPTPPAATETIPAPELPSPRPRRDRRAALVTAVLLILPILVIGYLAWRWARPSHTQAQPPVVSSTTTGGATSSESATSGGSGSPAGSGRRPSGIGADATQCSTNVWANPRTSCAFAIIVAGKAGEHSGETHSGTQFTIRAGSPVTKKTYEMTCSLAGTLTTCQGGEDAVVYLVR